MTRAEALRGLAVLLLLAGCKDDAPPRLVTVCDEKKTTIHTGTGVSPKGGVVIITTPVTVCLRSHLECRPAGEEYAGSLTCADVLAQEDTGEAG